MSLKCSYVRVTCAMYMFQYICILVASKLEEIDILVKKMKCYNVWAQKVCLFIEQSIINI